MIRLSDEAVDKLDETLLARDGGVGQKLAPAARGEGFPDSRRWEWLKGSGNEE
jgi:hypothetical protein